MLDAGEVAKITDFGISVASSASDGLPPLLRGFLDGPSWLTPSYCSPEQQAGAVLTASSDIWSWALSVLEMFTGEVSWSAGSMGCEALEAYRRVQPPIGIVPMPSNLVELLAACLRRAPAGRPESMHQIALQLQRIYSDTFGQPYFRQAPMALKEDAATLHNRSLSLLDLGRTTDALATWDIALKLDPLHLESSLHRELIRWRLGLQTDQEIIPLLERSESLNSSSWLPPYFITVAEAERGRREQALAALERADARGQSEAVVQYASVVLRYGDARWSGCAAVLSGHNGPVVDLSLSKDGRTAVSGSDDGGVRLWDLQSRSCVRIFDGHGASVTAVCLLPDGRQALSASSDGTVRSWDLRKSSCQRVFEGHDGPVTALAISVDGRLAFTASDDHTVRAWAVATGRCSQIFREDPLFLTSVADDCRMAAISCGLNEAGAEVLLTGSQDGKLRTWLVLTGQCVRVLQSPPSLTLERINPILSIGLAADGRLCATAHEDSIIRIWDLKTGQQLRSLKGHVRSVHCLRLYSDATNLVSGGADSTVRVWRLSTGQCVRTLEGHHGAVRSVAVSADDRRLVSGGEDGTIRMWTLPDPEIGDHLPLVLSRVQTDLVSLSPVGASEVHAADPDGSALGPLRWHRVADEAKHVRQVVITLPKGGMVRPGVHELPAHRAELAARNWAGITLLVPGRDPGQQSPLIVSKANGVIDELRGRDVTIAFAFYRLRAGGVLQIFVSVDNADVKRKTGYSFITENPHWLESDATRELVTALFSREHLEVCFVADEPPFGSCRGQFGVAVEISRECRDALLEEWASLMTYHDGIPGSRRDWTSALSQFEDENPIETTPILKTPN